MVVVDIELSMPTDVPGSSEDRSRCREEVGRACRLYVHVQFVFQHADESLKVGQCRWVVCIGNVVDAECRAPQVKAYEHTSTDQVKPDMTPDGSSIAKRASMAR